MGSSGRGGGRSSGGRSWGSGSKSTISSSSSGRGWGSGSSSTSTRPAPQRPNVDAVATRPSTTSSSSGRSWFGGAKPGPAPSSSQQQHAPTPQTRVETIAPRGSAGGQPPTYPSGQPPQRSPGLLQQAGATAAGSAVGHVAGAGISHALFGGSGHHGSSSGEAAPQQPQQQYPQGDQPSGYYGGAYPAQAGYYGGSHGQSGSGAYPAEEQKKGWSPFQKLMVLGLTGAACYGAYRLYRRSFSSTASGLARWSSSVAQPPRPTSLRAHSPYGPMASQHKDFPATTQQGQSSAVQPMQQSEGPLQQQQVKQPSLMAEIAAQAAGVAGGHVIGSGISRALFGGGAGTVTNSEGVHNAPPHSAPTDSSGTYASDSTYYKDWNKDYNSPVSGQPLDENIQNAPGSYESPMEDPWAASGDDDSSDWGLDD